MRVNHLVRWQGVGELGRGGVEKRLYRCWAATASGRAQPCACTQLMKNRESPGDVIQRLRGANSKPQGTSLNDYSVREA